MRACAYPGIRNGNAAMTSGRKRIIDVSLSVMGRARGRSDYRIGRFALNHDGVKLSGDRHNGPE